MCLCFWVILIFKSIDQVKQISSPVWMGFIQSGEGRNKTKRQRKEDCSHCLFSSWNIRPLLPLDSDSDWNLNHWLSCCSCFSGFGHWLELHHQLPGSPACRLQILGLLSCHNYVSQSIYIYIFISYYLYPYIAIAPSIYFLLFLLLRRTLTKSDSRNNLPKKLFLTCGGLILILGSQKIIRS